MGIEQIVNYLEISDGLACAGQPSREEYPLIREAGFDLVINLAMPDSPDAIPDEAELAHSLGLGYLAIPVVWEHTTLADLTKFFEAMDQHRAQRIFVHCVLNLRASVFVYLHRVARYEYRVARHEPQGAAWEDVLRIWTPDQTWTDFITLAVKDIARR